MPPNWITQFPTIPSCASSRLTSRPTSVFSSCGWQVCKDWKPIITKYLKFEAIVTPVLSFFQQTFIEHLPGTKDSGLNMTQLLTKSTQSIGGRLDRPEVSSFHEYSDRITGEASANSWEGVRFVKEGLQMKWQGNWSWGVSRGYQVEKKGKHPRQIESMVKNRKAIKDMTC